jgi:RNA polymerase sigma-70 factor (ECF subfamily)
VKRAWVPWRRELPPTPAVDPARFQDDDEPYPRHWRRFPEPWPPVTATDPEVADRLGDALDALPTTWREVVVGTDVAHGDPADTAARLDLTAGQERAIRNRARAFLREQLARHLARRGRR